MFSITFRSALLAFLAAMLVWALVLGWWQAGGYQPGAADLVTHLIVLPASLLAGFRLLYSFIEHLRAPGVDAASSGALGATTLMDSPPLPADRDERSSRVHLIGHALLSAHGTDAAQVAEASRQGCAPVLDDELRDVNGFPVFAARVPSLPIDEVTEQLNGLGAAAMTPALDDEDLRTLAMLHMTLPLALDEIAEMVVREPRALRSVIWLTSRAWPDARRTRLTEWLRREHLAPRGVEAVSVEVRCVRDDAQAFEAIDQLIADLNRQTTPAIVLVMGAVSHVGEGTVAQWQAESRLFMANMQEGLIPGEAAAVMLLANAAGAALTPGRPAALMSRAASGRSEHSAHAAASRALVGSCIDAALAGAGLNASDIANVFADADHRAGIARQLLPTLVERFPALEPFVDTLTLGTATGFASPIGGLVALLCAVDAVSTSNGAALCLTCQSPLASAAMIVHAGGSPSVSANAHPNA
ncbi:hypothetical protein GPA22_14290 [Aromatoleum toluvorans]|uniref:Uncharacterized protein n=1 Tax=Aromatoleum toluvorans TaxID=92002 RepID=A0ABX1Q256_9RHOO|nr:hypothetical protein [Aromatoleum toluvorans]NMG44892.1 hypothetical protein [Aromatoleum toluvorans]